MPRKYKRKDLDRRVVSKDQLEAVRTLLAQGLSKRKAAAQVGLKESTLRKRLKAGKTAESLGRFTVTFNAAQENDIFGYIKRCDDLYYGLNMMSLRKLIYEYAEVNNIPHRFNKTSKMAGRDWVYGFLDRHPELKLRQPTQTSIARAMGFNQIQVNTFYDNLENIYKKYNFPPSRVFNMDESGINTVPKKIPKVISMKGKKLVGKIVSAERGQTITLVCSMSATGNFIPPVFIFPRKRMKDFLLNNAPEGSIGMVSDSGFINTNLFLEYLLHFKDNVQPTKDNPVLLVLDNHSSHLSLAAINYCRDNGIHMLTLPPHSSHKLQPLDRGFFGPLKMKFAYACDKWLSHHPGRVIGQTEVAYLVNEAFQKAATLNNAVAGFRVSGIWPIDKHIFSDEDFAAASVTDVIPHTKETSRTTEETLDQNPSSTKTTDSPSDVATIEDSTSSAQDLPDNITPVEITPKLLETSDKTSSSLHQTFAQEAAPNTSQELMPDHSLNLPSIVSSKPMTPQPMQCEERESTSPSMLASQNCSSLLSFVIHSQTPTDFYATVKATTSKNTNASIASTEDFTPLTSIQPFPKATTQNRRRKGLKSVIITDSPYKTELEQKKREEEEKIAKKKPRLDLNKSTKKNDKNMTEKNNTKKKTASTKTVKDKKTVKQTTTSKETETEEYFCPLCNDKYVYPPAEDWIKCSTCNSWWHEQCTSFEQGAFVCDTCNDA